MHGGKATTQRTDEHPAATAAKHPSRNHGSKASTNESMHQRTMAAKHPPIRGLARSWPQSIYQRGPGQRPSREPWSPNNRIWRPDEWPMREGDAHAQTHMLIFPCAPGTEGQGADRPAAAIHGNGSSDIRPDARVPPPLGVGGGSGPEALGSGSAASRRRPISRGRRASGGASACDDGGMDIGAIAPRDAMANPVAH